jgi:glutathione S-transferase
VELGPEQKSDEHLMRQPFGQVPAIEDDGLVLFESGAIALHIAEKSDVLLPKDHIGRARAIAWLFAALNSVEITTQPLATIDFFHKEEAWTKERRPQLEAFMKGRLSLLARALGEKEYFDGQFTVADLIMSDVLRAIVYSGLLDQFPRLKAYQERCAERPAFQRAMTAQLSGFAKTP